VDMTIDPQYRYCTRCGGEYRPEIQHCADCGLALVSGEALLAGQQRRAARAAEIAPHEPVVVVHRGPVLQMKMLQAYLRERGLPSRVAKEAGGACGCRGPEVLLQVRAEDQAEALAALAQEYRESTGLDDHEAGFVGAVCDTDGAGTVCPACGCGFAPELSECPDCGLCLG